MFFLENWWPVLAFGVAMILVGAVSGRARMLIVPVVLWPVIFFGWAAMTGFVGLDHEWWNVLFLEIGAGVVCVALGLGLNRLVRPARGPVAGSS